MINYLGRFLSNLSTTIHPLTELLRNDKSWIWDDVHQRAYDSAKQLLSSAPVLSFYDPKQPVIVTSDASSYGLGGALWIKQDGQMCPVAFCSRTLSTSEKRFAQIEKELLAATWCCERFSRFLIGLNDFEIHTDHKPLISIIKNMDIDQAPQRCQRLLLRLMRYNATPVYVPGKSLVVADTMSRSPLPDQPVDTELHSDIEAHVNAITEAAAQVGGVSMEQIRKKGTRLTDDTIDRLADAITRRASNDIYRR